MDTKVGHRTGDGVRPGWVGTKARIWNWCRLGDAEDGTDAQAGLDRCLGLTQVLKDATFEVVFWGVLSLVNTWQEQG